MLVFIHVFIPWTNVSAVQETFSSLGLLRVEEDAADAARPVTPKMSAQRLTLKLMKQLKLKGPKKRERHSLPCLNKFDNIKSLPIDPSYDNNYAFMNKSIFIEYYVFNKLAEFVYYSLFCFLIIPNMEKMFLRDSATMALHTQSCTAINNCTAKIYHNDQV